MIFDLPYILLQYQIEMCSVTPSKQSIESISFEFSHRQHGLPSGEFLDDPEGLTYSNSFISASKQSYQQLPISIRIDHHEPQNKDALFPKIQRPKKYQVANQSRQISPHCLNLVLQSVKASPRNRCINENQTKQDKKLDKVTPKKKKSFSLNQTKNIEKINNQRAKTMLNLTVLKYLREQQENYSPKKNQIKKKETMSMKRKFKDHISAFRISIDGKQEPFELLDRQILAKKLTLGFNWDLQKKYLRKITQKRQTVRPCYPFHNQNP